MTRESRLASWLRDEAGIDEPRRVVRESPAAVVVSKLAPGLTAELFEAMDALSELLNEDAVRAEYECLAGVYRAAGENPDRTTVWREAAESLLRRLAGEREIDEARVTLIMPGIESVQAALDAVLWSAPDIDSPYSPRPSEASALDDLLGDKAERDVFTRYYGSLDGRRIEAYCPGSRYARRLLAVAYGVCTRG